MPEAELSVPVRAEAVHVIVVRDCYGVLPSAGHVDALGGRQRFANQRWSILEVGRRGERKG